MKIVTVQFNFPGRPRYDILLDVFQYSVKKYMPDVEFIEIKEKPPINKTRQPINFNYNHFKLGIWKDFICKSKPDEKIILADCDMMCLRPGYHAFNESFDIAYTARTWTTRIPNNGGIVFVRPTQKSKEFFKLWYEIDGKMLNDIPFHKKYRAVYAGQNQSSFGYMQETGNKAIKAHLHKYFTRQWNAVDCDWTKVNGETVFIHYKSKLREAVLGGIKKPQWEKVTELWQGMRKEADV